jgi:hypothetical protein
MSQQPTYAVPRILWESLESSLFAASRAFVRSIAEDVLEVPPAELLRAVFPSKDSLKVCLYDTDEVRHCPAFIVCPTNTDLADRCMKPILPGQQFCECHRYEHTSVQRRIEPPQMWTTLIVPGATCRLFLTADRHVVNAKGIRCGQYNEDDDEVVLFDFGTT